MTTLARGTRGASASGSALLDRAPAALAVEVPDPGTGAALTMFLRQHELLGECVHREGRILVDVRYPFELTDVSPSELVAVLAAFQQERHVSGLAIWLGRQRVSPGAGP